MYLKTLSTTLRLQLHYVFHTFWPIAGGFWQPWPIAGGYWQPWPIAGGYCNPLGNVVIVLAPFFNFFVTVRIGKLSSNFQLFSCLARGLQILSKICKRCVHAIRSPFPNNSQEIKNYITNPLFFTLRKLSRIYFSEENNCLNETVRGAIIEAIGKKGLQKDKQNTIVHKIDHKIKSSSPWNLLESYGRLIICNTRAPQGTLRILAHKYGRSKNYITIIVDFSCKVMVD